MCTVLIWNKALKLKKKIKGIAKLNSNFNFNFN